jgi:hypothetical protein
MVCAKTTNQCIAFDAMILNMDNAQSLYPCILCEIHHSYRRLGMSCISTQCLQGVAPPFNKLPDKLTSLPRPPLPPPPSSRACMSSHPPRKSPHRKVYMRSNIHGHTKSMLLYRYLVCLSIQLQWFGRQQGISVQQLCPAAQLEK